MMNSVSLPMVFFLQAFVSVKDAKAAIEPSFQTMKAVAQ